MLLKAEKRGMQGEEELRGTLYMSQDITQNEDQHELKMMLYYG